MSVEEPMTVEGAIDRYADMVYRLALSQMKNQADAEDLFQEVFVRLVKHMDKMKSWEHVKAWLLKVTVNCASKHFDGAWHRRVIFLEETEYLAETGESSLMEKEHPVRDAVEELPEKYRLVIHLFYYEELSITEIARITNQKESTVKSQLFRAREMLRESLKGDPDL